MHRKLLKNGAWRKHVLPQVYSRTRLHFKTTTGTISIVPLSLVPKQLMYKYQPIFQVVYCLLNYTWSHKHFPSVLIQHFQENLCHTGYKFKTSCCLISRIIIPENQFSTLIGSSCSLLSCDWHVSMWVYNYSYIHKTA